MAVRVKSEGLGGSHCVVRVRGEGGLGPWGLLWRGKEVGKRRNVGVFWKSS